MKLIIILFITGVGLILGFYLSPSTVAYPKFHTEELMQSARLTNFISYFLQGVFLGAFSYFGKYITKSKINLSFYSTAYIIILYIGAITYNRHNYINFNNFLRLDFLFLVIGSFSTLSAPTTIKKFNFFKKAT
ncbi:MAG: hypothetical protein HRU38_19910 [Saccharospirillaceae bacterium]|nr:hypothetical protein [Pseudomonadales bacterium]NRB80899.1 hypothetical protein [Saccharospirillaceae bacterium]